jgi:mRNA interferase MazF
MALLFKPQPGTILVCDYSGSVYPEMGKVRPVIVVSPTFKHRPNLSTIVPLSTTAPNPVEDYHHALTLNPALPPPFDSPQMWVKADMIMTASHDRLDRIRAGRNAMGQRTYANRMIPKKDLEDIYRAVLNGLGLGRLTPHI